MAELNPEGLFGSSRVSFGSMAAPRMEDYHEGPTTPRPAFLRLCRESVEHDVGSIAVREFHDVQFNYPWHCHPELELTLILEGSGQRHVGDSIETFGPGDLVLVGSDTPHCWLSASTTCARDAAIVVQFRRDAFGRGFLELPETRPLRVLLKRAAGGLKFEGPTRELTQQKIRELAHPNLTPMEKLSGLISVLTLLADGGGARCLALAFGSEPAPTHETSRVNVVLRHIRDHCSEPLLRNDVARLAGMSSGTFSRFFSRYFGKSFVAYVAEVRIGNACRLLREENMTVSNVAHASGFHNLANFNRTFLRLKGITPTAYRRLARSTG